MHPQPLRGSPSTKIFHFGQAVSLTLAAGGLCFLLLVEGFSFFHRLGNEAPVPPPVKDQFMQTGVMMFASVVFGAAFTAVLGPVGVEFIHRLIGTADTHQFERWVVAVVITGLCDFLKSHGNDISISICGCLTLYVVCSLKLINEHRRFELMEGILAGYAVLALELLIQRLWFGLITCIAVTFFSVMGLRFHPS